MFTSTKEIFRKANKDRFVVGAFNTSGLEITQAICETAHELDAPVIIQTSPKTIEYTGLEQIFDIVRDEVEEQQVMAVIHLDHAKDFGLAKQCIDLGYPSVMIDGSKLNYESNVALTRKVVNYAKREEVAIEGELGVISEGEKKADSAKYTDPKMAVDFVNKTGISSLAVSVGNRHGAPKGEKLNLKLLRKISNSVSVPLVMHGASGLSRRDIRLAAKSGVMKFNIDTNIKKAFSQAVKSKRTGETDPRVIMNQAKEAVKKVIKEYINLFSMK